MPKKVVPFYPRNPDAWKGVKVINVVMRGGFGSQTLRKEKVLYAETVAEAAILQDQGYTVTPLNYKENKE